MTDTTELRRRLREDHSDPEHVRKHGPDALPHDRCRVCQLLTALDAEDAEREKVKT